MFLNRRDNHLPTIQWLSRELLRLCGHALGTQTSRAEQYPIKNQGLDTTALAQSAPMNFAFFSDASKILCETPLFVLA
jgi:hypothetical protein